ncbi:Multidrug resistance protein MdtE [Phycisphaerales bacterium]|nr:Multidrug resistance protein MdtE [Phycisphaerales bacterium]
MWWPWASGNRAGGSGLQWVDEAHFWGTPLNLRQSNKARFPRWLAALGVSAAFVVGVATLMLWLVGAFRPKVAADASRGAMMRPIGSGRVVEVVARTLPMEETAVGTIQPVHRVEVASRLLARAVEVNVVAGQRVSEGEVLVRVEDTDLRARLAQAESGVEQAQAGLDQARIEESRLRAAFEKNAAAGIEVDRAVNALKGAEAAVSRARQAKAEAATVLEFATIRSPIEGVVVDKRVNSGDTVLPGQVVVTLLDPTRMQMVASVRESLSRRLSVGASVSVKVDVLDHACSGVVSEIVPEAEGSSRTFQVKVTGPCPEGVYTGMFGRLSIPVGEERVLLIPPEAVRTVGQVECVDVASEGSRVRRAVRLGRSIEGQVEVLAGLVEGERIVIEGAPEGR